MTPRVLATVFMTLLLALGAGLVAAEEAGTPVETEEGGDRRDRERWQTVYRQVMAEWEIVTEGHHSDALRLEPEPVMNWASLDDFNGSVFIWTHHGKPELIGSVFSHTRRVPAGSRGVVTEFQSLSPMTLRVTGPERGETVLEPAYEAVRFSGVEAPAANPRLLRSQVKRIAGRFTAHMQHEDQRWELRLLPQPIVQYERDGESPDDECLIRCLFVFVGFITDPEVILLLEARQTERGGEWLYQPFRFSNRPLAVEFDGRLVWDSPVPSAAEPPKGYTINWPGRVLSLPDSPLKNN